MVSHLVDVGSQRPHGPSQPRITLCHRSAPPSLSRHPPRPPRLFLRNMGSQSTLTLLGGLSAVPDTDTHHTVACIIAMGKSCHLSARTTQLLA